MQGVSKPDSVCRIFCKAERTSDNPQVLDTPWKKDIDWLFKQGLAFVFVYGNSYIRADEITEAAGDARSIFLKCNIVIALVVGQSGKIQTAFGAGFYAAQTAFAKFFIYNRMIHMVPPCIR